MLSAGEDVGTLQLMTGHANVSFTLRYDRRPAELMRNASQRVNTPSLAGV